MRLLSVLVAAALWIGGEAPTAWAQNAAPPSVPAIVDTTIQFSIQVGNRLYPEWKEDLHVRVGERFYLGDTEFNGEVRKFLPDFRIIDGKILSLSNAMNNPAIQVFVWADSGAVDSSWAFLNFPPHFSPNSFFTFQLKEVRGYEAPPSTPQPAKESKKE